MNYYPRYLKKSIHKWKRYCFDLTYLNKVRIPANVWSFPLASKVKLTLFINNIEVETIWANHLNSELITYLFPYQHPNASHGLFEILIRIQGKIDLNIWTMYVFLIIQVFTILGWRIFSLLRFFSSLCFIAMKPI